MLTSYRIGRFIKKFAYHELIRHCQGYYANAKGLHSLQVQTFRRTKFVRPVKGKSIKSNGKNATKEETPKMYMREIIGKISKILRYSMWDSAQDQLEKLSIRWDSYTVNQVLKTHPPMEKAWLFFNWTSKLKGFKHDQFTYTTMLDIFGEAGRISSMKHVFQQMQEKGIIVDAVTYTSLLHWLSKDGDLEGALKMWEEMKSKGCCPTVVTYTAFIKILFEHNRVKEAIGVYREMLESGCTPNCYTYTVLMEYLASTGRFREALQILSKMQEAGVQPDKATCNILVQKCSRAGEIWAMNHILQYMKENAFVLRHPVYREALEALQNTGESDELLREINPHLSFADTDIEETSECETSTTTLQTIIDRAIVINFLVRRNFIAVEHMLNVSINKKIPLDSRAISAIIKATCANHRPTCAVSAFNYGIEMGIYIERPACLALMGFFIRSNSFSELVDIVEKMIGAGFSLDTYLLSLLIYKLGCNQRSASSKKVFNSLPDDQKNVVTYTALMGAHFCSRDADEGLEVFNSMRRKGIRASSGTYRILILGLKESGREREAEIYYKDKKSIERNGFAQEMVSMEEHLCDLIFAGDLAPFRL